MLKTYRMIPLVFILFLFGFTLITVSPVIAEDSPEFVACQQIKPRDIQTLKNKKDCFRDLARALVTGGAVAQANGADSPEQVSTSPSGGEVAELNARIAESESQVATLTTTNAQLQEQLMSASAALEPLNAKVAELETRVSAANAAQEPLNAKVTELETQVSAASAALDQANENIAKLNNYVETTASTYKAREASITEQYMTLNDNATMLVETNHNLADKLQIHEQGVAHMAILLDKMISHHAYHKRKSHKSSRSALVIHESMRYELSCMSSHVDDVAFCARISAMPPGKRESGSVYLHKFE
jgi:predicted RNase H-like nuclease (RuvC/YqgF family)